MFEYRTLDSNALKVVENNAEVHALFLDCLSYLHDVVSIASPAIEPPYFTRDMQFSRLEEIIAKLPDEATLQGVVSENFEKALALANHTREPSFQQFFRDLCSEYNVVRRLGQHASSKAFSPA